MWQQCSIMIKTFTIIHNNTKNKFLVVHVWIFGMFKEAIMFHVIKYADSYNDNIFQCEDYDIYSIWENHNQLISPGETVSASADPGKQIW